MNKKETRFTYFYNMSSNIFSTNLLKDRIKCIYDKVKFDIPDVLELYQINEYIKKFKIEFEDEKYGISKNHKLININLYSIKDIIIFLEKHSLNPYYNYYLWNIVSDYYMKKDLGSIKDLIKFYNDKITIRYPLQNKQIVNKYSSYINKIICDHSVNAEMFLNDNNQIIMPEGFIKDGYKGKLFNLYLDSDTSNINCIDNIIYDKKIYNDTYKQSLIILKAKDKKKSINEKLFESNNGKGLRTNIAVKISNDILESNKITSGFPNFQKSLNYDLLSNNLDNKSNILNNFIYVLNLVSMEFLVNSINNNNDKYFFLSLFSNKNENIYDYDRSRDQDTISLMSFYAYYDMLKEKGINLEEVFSYFFNYYLDKCFSIRCFKNIDINSSSKKVSEKCEHIVAQIHRIVRTYNLYTLDNNFDERLIDIESKTPRFCQLNSLNNKYVYFKDNKLLQYCSDLFSNFVNNKYGNNTTNFTVSKYNSLYDYDKAKVDNMIKDNILFIDNDNNVKVKDSDIVCLFMYYSKYGVIPYYWIPTNLRNKVNDLISSNKMYFYNKLLSKAESDYFEYFLSNYFNNGIGLRNIYAHGAGGHLTTKEHNGNYLRLMFLLCILIIKINEEFDYRDGYNKYSKDFINRMFF
ncbi:hypothetical protein DY124_01705 [Apilactobacillus micheneri]|uniref:hypothetical protein n=1 Tax=Apilactobacillus micheneri TaxID=1899430 RepID=UPI00112CB05D|nr:hypothetical protein [Apilactobacillus micheneri]TPR42729.1 hypothetical protein DY123_01695 [Apilactobacillus micheneri]TPR45696.1 hypothetical protein DY124_01705 [Apilactobacillus micheneri]TPR49143.1 hypothetical protein DY125_01705 [Apilactobacillus micheneri]